MRHLDVIHVKHLWVNLIFLKELTVNSLLVNMCIMILVINLKSVLNALSIKLILYLNKIIEEKGRHLVQIMRYKIKIQVLDNQHYQALYKKCLMQVMDLHYRVYLVGHKD